ncbi:methyl-accepting chemotaxis protein [Rhodopila globiformis]|nr:methyl-accepting chemotaxis protein [Rhodopila globiformis]
MRHTPSILGKLRSAGADRRIATKIGLGFTCTMVISGLAFGMVWFTFRSTENGFKHYTNQVVAADTVRDLSRTFAELRRAVREYALTGVEDNVKKAGTIRPALDQLVHRAADHVTGSAAQRRVETIARHLQAYESEFDKVVAQKRQLIELEIGQLDPLGAAGVEGFQTLIGAATAASDQDRLRFAYQALQQFMTAQVEANRFLGRNDPAREKDTEDMLNDLVASLGSNGGQGDDTKKSVAQTVSSRAAEMQAAAGSLTGTAQKATSRATAVAAAVEQASVNVQVVASSTEELSASVHEIARQMAQSSKIARQAVQRAERTNTIVEGMTKTAQGIGDVVRLIQTIANQTNLLALNATIEAARAGDAGKGFAVVASEVKSLASQTAKATSEIRNQIDDIQAVTGQATEAIREISGTIGEMNEIAMATASAVEEQGAATQEIASSVRQAAEGTNEIARNIEGVSQAANDTGAAATQLLGSADSLARQADSLQHDVDSFLVKVRSA